MKNVASSQEVICEHMVRPSQLKGDEFSSAVSVGAGDVYATLDATASIGMGAVLDLNLPYPIQASVAITIKAKMFFTCANSPRCKA